MKGRKLIVILTIVLIVGGTTGFLVYFFGFKDQLDLPLCINRPFTAYPADMSRIMSITPLGNLNPSDHTFPTDHMYFNTNLTAFPDGFAIFAPGNITITSLSLVTYDPPQSGISEDYSISFDVCQDGSQFRVSGRFGHINNLSDFLWNIIGSFGTEYGDTIYTWEVSGRNYSSYNKYTDIKVDAGQLLGVAGQMGGFDFWLKDSRVELDFVNEDWTEEFQHTVSPLAYFREDLRTVMTAKLLDYGLNPVDPVGYEGRIDFDVLGTAQGIWVRADYSGRVEDNGLALVFFNFNASLPVFSIGYAGNSTWDSRVYRFRPQDSGYQDRLFDDVINDGNIYYFLVADIWNSNYNMVILIKMTGERELLFQFISTGGSPPADPVSLFNEELAISYIR